MIQKKKTHKTWQPSKKENILKKKKKQKQERKVDFKNIIIPAS